MKVTGGGEGAGDGDGDGDGPGTGAGAGGGAEPTGSPPVPPPPPPQALTASDTVSHKALNRRHLFMSFMGGTITAGARRVMMLG